MRVSESGIVSGRDEISYRGFSHVRGGRIKTSKFNNNSYDNKIEIKFAPLGHQNTLNFICSNLKGVIVHNIQKMFPLATIYLHHWKTWS